MLVMRDSDRQMGIIKDAPTPGRRVGASFMMPICLPWPTEMLFYFNREW
jgi:hypothetical protein